MPDRTHLSHFRHLKNPPSFLHPPMECWIRKFSMINQKHTDTSDYEKFFTHAQRYLEANPSTHDEISKILVEALEKFRNKSLLSITYRLLCNMGNSPEIPDMLLKRHFKSRQLRKHMFPLISKLNLKIFDSKLLRLLYDPFYECKDFFKLMKSRKAWVPEFLSSRDRALARKQMMVVIHTSVFLNLDYFLSFFGHHDRSLSFLAFEVFSLFIKRLKHEFEFGKEMNTKRPKPDANNPIILHKESLFSVCYSGGKTWISLKTLLEVECPTNFLIHFLDFASDSDVLHELIAREDGESIDAVLRRYIVTRKPIIIPNSRWIIQPSMENTRKWIFSEEEICFEYLFNGCSYKDMMDCIEI